MSHYVSELSGPCQYRYSYILQAHSAEPPPCLSNTSTENPESDHFFIDFCIKFVMILEGNGLRDPPPGTPEIRCWSLEALDHQKSRFGMDFEPSWGPSRLLLGPFFAILGCKSDIIWQPLLATPSGDARRPFLGAKSNQKA